MPAANPGSILSGCLNGNTVAAAVAGAAGACPDRPLQSMSVMCKIENDYHRAPIEAASSSEVASHSTYP